MPWGGRLRETRRHEAATPTRRAPSLSHCRTSLARSVRRWRTPRGSPADTPLVRAVSVARPSLILVHMSRCLHVSVLFALVLACLGRRARHGKWKRRRHRGTAPLPEKMTVGPGWWGWLRHFTKATRAGASPRSRGSRLDVVHEPQRVPAAVARGDPQGPGPHSAPRDGRRWTVIG